ncbi:MAG: M20/M25/M40 family metallo-hydrolase [Armatimonadota bacterium]
MHDLLREMLDRFLVTHSPPGQEEEMAAAVRPYLEAYCDQVWVDAHDDVIGRIAGESAEGAIVVAAHKDEIGCVVERVEDDGCIRLEDLGGMQAWRYGEGPFDLLGDEIVTGVLSVGSTHVSARSAEIHAAKTNTPMSWDAARVVTGLSREELAARGVRVGTRALVARSRKTPMYMGERVCGYGLDDKGAVAASLLAAKLLSEGAPPPVDVYIAITSAEEGGCSGGQFVAHHLPVDTMIAVEVAPIAPEYDFTMSAAPVVVFKDRFFYTRSICERLCALGDELGCGHQRTVLRTFGSDASVAHQAGAIGKAACIGYPTENTHGYEMAHLGAIENCGRLLAAYLADPVR